MCVCVYLCLWSAAGTGPVAFLSLRFSLSFSLTGSAGFFIQGPWSIWPFCLAINIDQRSSILSAPRQRPRMHCVRLPFLYHSPTNPQTALSLYEGILAWPEGHHEEMRAVLESMLWVTGLEPWAEQPEPRASCWLISVIVGLWVCMNAFRRESSVDMCKKSWQTHSLIPPLWVVEC